MILQVNTGDIGAIAKIEMSLEKAEESKESPSWYLEQVSCNICVVMLTTVMRYAYSASVQWRNRQGGAVPQNFC